MLRRKNKLIEQGLVIIVVVATIGATIVGSVYLADFLDKKTGTNNQCTGSHINHQVVIQNDKVEPSNTVAPLCDSLTITNLDDKTRLMAFGEHDAHKVYDGVEEKLLNKDQKLTVTLVEAGNYIFHDHNQDEVHGSFTVTKP